MITLYVDGHFVSPLDATCLVALDEKGLEYQTARALLRDGQGVPAPLGKQALIARVPVLQHGDFFLSESLAIVEYLEDTFPAPPVFPAEPRRRARAKQIMSFLRCELAALREERPWWTTIYFVEHPPLSPRARQEADDLLAIASRVVPELGAYSIAHADLAFQLMRLTHTGHAVPDALRDFVDTTLALPPVRRYLERARPPNPPARTLGGG